MGLKVNNSSWLKPVISDLKFVPRRHLLAAQSRQPPLLGDIPVIGMHNLHGIKGQQFFLAETGDLGSEIRTAPAPPRRAVAPAAAARRYPGNRDAQSPWD